MSDRDIYAVELSKQVEEMLRVCPDYSENPGRCRIYGTCRWLGPARNPSTESLAMKWIDNCIKLQAAKRKGESPLEQKT